MRRSSRVLERALGEKEALDVLLDYAADEGDGTRGDQGQRLNEAMTLHEVRNVAWKDCQDNPSMYVDATQLVMIEVPTFVMAQR